MLFREVFLLLIAAASVTSLEWEYHNNSELARFLTEFANSSKNGVRTRLYSIGQSVKKNDLWVMEVTAAKQEKTGIPNIKLIGTVHGNEPVGREILLHLMEHLRDNYRADPQITWLLDNTKIHFLPNLNPDGFALANENMCEGEHGRNNGWKGKDLNRNFPDYFIDNRIPEEPETKAVREWLTDVPFILSAALHGGALVANYPFDSVKEFTSDSTLPPSLTPDNDVFVHLAQVYSRNHLTMHRGDSCAKSEGFNEGITNGAAWYPVTGGMQDYNYAFHGCMEITLEISCCKYPNARELPQLWKENKNALLSYCMEALRGVTGIIFDLATRRPIAKASLRISGRSMTFYSSKTGEFWRLLLPGSYKLEISVTGFYDQVVPFIVEDFGKRMPQLSVLNVYMLNASVSTTTEEQRTTEESVRFVESSSDGASTTVDGNVGMLDTEDKPVHARQIRLNEENLAVKNVLHNYICVSGFIILFYVYDL